MQQEGFFFHSSLVSLLFHSNHFDCNFQIRLQVYQNIGRIGKNHLGKFLLYLNSPPFYLLFIYLFHMYLYIPPPLFSTLIQICCVMNFSFFCQL